MVIFEGIVLDRRFRLLRSIGEGGMGTVYEAEHVAIGRRVAVKILKPELSHIGEAVARFRREAQVAGSIGHDNICDVLDVGTTSDGLQYLVMPLLRGRALIELIGDEGPMPIRRALDITSQVLDGLAAAHRAGVVHRDLKPENVFITRVGDRADFVKILDFGISKIIGDDPLGVHQFTRTGFVIGTPQYLAPEQLQARRDVDHRADLFAVGALMFEMLTARAAYEADSVIDVIYLIGNEPVRPPRQLRPEIPASVEAIVLRAMSRDRDHRYLDAPAMRRAVRESMHALEDPTARILRACGDAEITQALEAARSDCTTERVMIPAARRPALVVLAAVLLCLLAAAVVSLHRPGPLPSSLADAPPRPVLGAQPAAAMPPPVHVPRPRRDPVTRPLVVTPPAPQTPPLPTLELSPGSLDAPDPLVPARPRADKVGRSPMQRPPRHEDSTDWMSQTVPDIGEVRLQCANR